MEQSRDIPTSASYVPFNNEFYFFHLCTHITNYICVYPPQNKQPIPKHRSSSIKTTNHNSASNTTSTVHSRDHRHRSSYVTHPPVATLFSNTAAPRHPNHRRHNHQLLWASPLINNSMQYYYLTHNDCSFFFLGSLSLFLSYNILAPHTRAPPNESSE